MKWTRGGPTTNYRLKLQQERLVAYLEANSALHDPQLPLTPEDELLAADRSAVIAETFAIALTPREERVVRLYFGIGCEPHTLEQVAQQFSVTRERIRQIKLKAFRKLRHPARGLHIYASEHTDRWRGDKPERHYVPQWKRDQERARIKMAEQLNELRILADAEQHRDWHAEDMLRRVEERIEHQRAEQSFQIYVETLKARFLPHYRVRLP